MLKSLPNVTKTNTLRVLPMCSLLLLTVIQVPFRSRFVLFIKHNELITNVIRDECNGLFCSHYACKIWIIRNAGLFFNQNSSTNVSQSKESEKVTKSISGIDFSQ